MKLFVWDSGNDADPPQARPDVDFDVQNTRQSQSLLDPSELIFMALNTGTSRDMAVMVMMLEASRELRKNQTRGELR